MIIKSLSRKASGTGQLFNYLFRYMLNEEKQELLGEPLRSLAAHAQNHTNEKEFEESLEQQELLQYYEVSPDTIGTPDTLSNTHGTLGYGFYFSKKPPAKEITEQAKEIKKYILDIKKLFFDAGKENANYYKLWANILKESNGYTSLSDPHEKIREQLEREGYVGIKTDTQTIVFDPRVITELPDGFFKYSREYFTNAKTDHKEPHFVLRHNVHSRSIPGYVKEFEKNETSRIHKRKDSVQVYHTILSFSNKDKTEINDVVLRDMAKKYIELRGKDNLYVITSHNDKDHIHLHCAMSGTKLNGLSSRVSRQEFANIKVALDAYQKEKYPQLKYSLPRHGKAKDIEHREDFKNIKRNERSVDKNDLLKVLDDIYSRATSQEQFLAELKTTAHEPYYRAGKLTGVKYNGERKFRLNRLGYSEDKLLALSLKTTEEKALQEIQELRSNSQKELTQQTTFLEYRLQSLDNEKQRKELQELVNRNRTFEVKHNIPRISEPIIKEETGLQELRDIRENRGMEIDKSESREDIDRDRIDDIDHNSDDDKTDDKDTDDDGENHKNAASDADSDDSDDDSIPQQ